MKTEITIDGITYKVGDVLERENYETREILAIGSENFFVKILYNKYESTLSMVDLKHWKIKKPKKKVVAECWLNIYKDGDIARHETKEDADNSAAYDRIACEYVKFEYEIEQE